MDNFKNVDVDKLANIYFEGKVISRNIYLKDGTRKTLGIMLVGEYEFNTVTKELKFLLIRVLDFKLGIDQ